MGTAVPVLQKLFGGLSVAEVHGCCQMWMVYTGPGLTEIKYPHGVVVCLRSQLIFGILLDFGDERIS